MKTAFPSLRLARLLAATSLTAASLGMLQTAAAQDAADPPWRVGRLAQINGSVSTHGAGATDWVDATINLPLTSGNAVWTQPGSGASVQIVDNLVALSEATELDLATLDNRQFIATEPQGEVFLDLRDVPSGDSYAITTPRGAVQLGGAGQYGIIAGDSATPTSISVISGSARIISGSFSLEVAAGQTALVTGGDVLQGSVGPLVRDSFLEAHLRRPVRQSVEPQPVRYMTGGELLGGYGDWQPSPDYGQVWYPRVQSGWAPYREGSWAYVAPWGWTWVDNEPWGFAPFHYGRWAQFDGRWGWVPSERQASADIYEQPAYAPALVDFVVAGAVGGLVAGAFAGHGDNDRYDGGRGGDIGWIPLGPREQYRPQFNASQTYMSRVNYGRDSHAISINNSRDNHSVNNTTIINNYANRSALTVIPVSAMARSEPVGRVARTGAAALRQGSPGAGAAARFQPVRGAFPVQPVADTRGVTPAVAQRLGLKAGGARPSAPGPAINQQLFAPHQLPANRTPFRGQSGTGAGHPGINPAAAPGGTPGSDRPPGLGPAMPTPRPGGPPNARELGTAPAMPAAPGRPAAGALPAVQPNGLPALRAPGARPLGAPGEHPSGGRPPVELGSTAHPSIAGPTPGIDRAGSRPETHAAGPGAAAQDVATPAWPQAPRPASHPAAPRAVPARPPPPRAPSPQPVQRAQPPRVEARPVQHQDAPHPQAPRPPQAGQRPEPPRAPQHEAAPRPQPAQHPEPHPAAPPHPSPDPHRDDHHHP